MQDTEVFTTYKELVDFISANTYNDKVTYYDPTKGWVLVYHERYSGDEYTLEGGGDR